MAYFLLSSNLVQKDREEILLELKELATIYNKDGMASLKKETTLEYKSGKKVLFFIRISGLKNKTLFVGFPGQWEEFDIRKLEQIPPDSNREWVQLQAKRGEHVLELASERLDDGYWLQVGKSTEDRERLLEHFREIFAAVVIPVVLLGFISGLLLAYRALRPIRNLIQVVQSIDISDMKARVPSPQTGDELDELVTLFNGMLEKIEILFHAMKESLDNVAHDLRTPMTRLRGTAEMALQSGQNVDVYREALSDCIEESERILMMLNTLMDISEAETGVMKLDLESVCIPDVIAAVLDIYRYVAEEKNISIHLNVAPGIYLCADPKRMSQVLANLLDNAIKYTPCGGSIHFNAYRQHHRVIITVEDNGIGIPHEDIPRIWDRLYRGDQSRSSQKGLGLGLSLVKAIVEAHGGLVDVISEPGKGSTFVLSFPEQSHASKIA